MRLLAAIVLLCVSVAAERAVAQEWAARLFEERSHDFGTVARGADTVHRFQARNIFKQDIELVSVRSSCGCTTATIDSKLLKTGDVGYVTAVFNTRTFTGLHGATLTVETRWNDSGTWRRGETQLRVNGNIRGDVVFRPGAVRFDNVEQGKISEQVVEVTYAGRSDWRVVDVRGASDDLEVELSQSQRFSGRVAYELLVRLKDSAPAGYFNDQLVLVTSDNQNPRIPLHISGRVLPEISVAPETVLLGEVPRGGQASKRVLVRGKQPFRILAIHSDDEECFDFKTDDEANIRHMVEIIFTANRQLGPVRETVHIATDLGEMYRATLSVYATVVPAAPEVEPADADAATAGGDAGTASAAAVAGD